MFCLLTMAVEPAAHRPPLRRTESEFGRHVVVGTFIYSLLLGMSVPDISGRAIANLGASELRHMAPVFCGDTIYGVTEVLAVRPSQIAAATRAC